MNERDKWIDSAHGSGIPIELAQRNFRRSHVKPETAAEFNEWVEKASPTEYWEQMYYWLDENARELEELLRLYRRLIEAESNRTYLDIHGRDKE